MSGAADDLQFGEVQERLPEPPPLSPDRNGHLATARVIRPNAAASRNEHQRGRGPRSETRAASTDISNDTPTDVYVQLEPFLEMQQHAAEDTSIELGGLLLGRRGEHPDGTPWVMICDSLRARHYRATRGSFRFTHETWADLNQQRAELPESTEIVGWYHTHPGWGVFLSDQDIFICDHFFAHPDDVALVIDPTNGDTGLFVRRGSPRDQPPQRLGGYQLYAHRNRAAELSAWASYFSGVGTVLNSPSTSDRPAIFPSSHSPPVIVTTGADHAGAGKTWAALAAGLLGAQVAILVAILVALSTRSASLNADAAATRSADPEAMRIREAVVDDLLSKIASDGPEGASRSWRETALANEQLRAANLGLLSRVDALTAELQTDRRQLQQANRELASVGEQLAEAESKLSELVAASAAQTAAEAAASESTAESSTAGMPFDWKAVLVGAAGGVVVGWLVFAFAARRQKRSKSPDFPLRREPVEREPLEREPPLSENLP